MSAKHELHLVYVLHSRAFRETSLLIEVFSQEHGRMALVARGAKRGRSKNSSLLQIFAPLTVSWYGNGELVTLTHVESTGNPHALYGRRAICGLYVNELMIKLLHKWDPCLQLFHAYEQTLVALSELHISEQITLRIFEKALLKSIGYALQLTTDVDTGKLIQSELYYQFLPTLGPRLVSSSHPNAIKGQSLLALDAELFESPPILVDIKRLMRMVLAHHLGTHVIVARELL